MKKRILSFIIIICCHSIIIAQISKGDWQVGFNLNAYTSHVIKDIDFTDTKINNRISIGRFLSENILAGMELEHTLSETYYVSAENLGIRSGGDSVATYGAGLFFTGYLRNTIKTWRPLALLQFNYNKEKFDSDVFSLAFRTRNKFIVTGGLGINKRINRFLYFESILTIPMVEWFQIDKNKFTYARFNSPPALVSAGIQLVLNNSTFKTDIDTSPIYKGKILSIWPFQKTETPNTFATNPKFGWLVSDKIAVGGSIFFEINSKEDLKWVSIGTGPFIRYYVKGGNRLHFFPEVSYTFTFSNNFYAFFPANRSSISTRHKIQFGSGINYFINDKIALEFAGHSEVTWSNIENITIYKPKDRKLFSFDVGFLFFLKQKDK